MGSASVYTFTVPTILWLVCCLRYVSARRTRFIFRDGWLLVRKGVFFHGEKSYELTHLVSATILRGPIDQLTGNAKLILNFDKFGTVLLFGCGDPGEVAQLRDRLVNGARLLRSHPLLKGLIGT